MRPLPEVQPGSAAVIVAEDATPRTPYQRRVLLSQGMYEYKYINKLLYQPKTKV